GGTAGPAMGRSGPVELLEAVDLDFVLVLEPFDSGPGPRDGRVERDPLREGGGADRSRVRNGPAPLLDRVDHERDVAVDQQVDHVRTTILDLVDPADGQSGGGDRGGGSLGREKLEAELVQAAG